jgi:predicted AAA+ superfamily ATPase
MYGQPALFRFAREHFPEWKGSSAHRPLLVHGARQVGKTYLIVEYGRSAFENLVHVDFDQDPGLDQLFASQSPRAICQLLEFHYQDRIVPGKTLLFLDEIQLAPAACTALLRFAEEYPELHLAAAGPLPDDWPATRIPAETPGAPGTPGAPRTPAAPEPVDHFYLGPIRFDEFLLIAGESRLFGLLQTLPIGESFPDATHQKLMGLAQQFLFSGGMPAVLAALVEKKSVRDCVEAKRAVQAALWDELGRRTGRLDPARVNRVLARLPAQVGAKLKYAALDPGARARDVKPVLDALCFARIARRVPYTACTGPTLASTASQKHFKLLYLDVGLLAGARGLDPADLEGTEDILAVADGGLCRQFAGQHLLHAQPPRVLPELHTWEREARTSMAEVDFVIGVDESVIPVHVRAGKPGTLRSLHRFAHERRPPLAVRLDAAPPSLGSTDVRLPEGPAVSCPLLSLPFYMAGQVHRLCREWLASDAARGPSRRAVR